MAETKEIFVTVEIPQQFIDAYMEFYKDYKAKLEFSRAHIGNLYKKYVSKSCESEKDFDDYTNYIAEESDN